MAHTEARGEALELLNRIGLADKADEFPDRLSGGQQQRVAIVRALAMDPKLMLLDEITSALDPQLVAEVLNLVRELADIGMTMIIATHEMSFAQGGRRQGVLPRRRRDLRGGRTRADLQQPAAAADARVPRTHHRSRAPVKRLAPPTKAPLALAAFLALPVFFASLMASSLALEKPRVVEWSRPHGHLARIFHVPSSSNEVRIWLFALVPPLVLVLAGWIASFFPYSLYLTCGAAIVDGLALFLRLHRWELHHTVRFPYGEDLLADQTTSSSLARGEWEKDAADTVRSLVHYTIGLAITAALISLFLAYRRRRNHRPRPLAGEGGPELQQTGGAPTATGGV